MKHPYIASSYLLALTVLIGCSLPLAPPSVRSTLSPAFVRAKYTRVAVYISADEGSSRHIEEEFVKALIRKKYVVPARSDLALILREQSFQSSGITEKAAVNLGKLIDVQAIIIVSVDRSTETISARMIDVETGEIVWIGKTDSGPYFFTKARYLARTIPPAEDPSEVFKKEWDYNKAEGYYAATFNPQGIDKVILQIRGLERAETQRVEGEVIAKLMENGYRVPSRSDVEAILKEHNFNVNMLSDAALVQLGRLSNTRYMMIVWMSRITKLSEKADPLVVNNDPWYPYGCSCVIRIVDLEKSNIVWSGSLFESGLFGSGEKVEVLYDRATKRLVESGLIPKK